MFGLTSEVMHERVYTLGLTVPSLQDTHSASTTLLMHLAAAFAQFASHEETIRTQMKAMLKSEEGLDELKKKSKVAGVQADAADKKLSKMSSEVCSSPFENSFCLSQHKD